MSTNKVSIIIPCLWTEQRFIDMTFKCISSLGDVGQIIVVGNNASFAHNVNTGLRAANGNILVISNNDIEFIQPDWIEHLTKPLTEGYGIASIRTTDSDGWETEDKLTENDKFGSLWAMTRETYETLGPLDESFGRGYFEDLDYWHRAQKLGIKICKNHAGLVEHKGQATFDTFGTEADRIYNLAMLKYAEKHPDSYLIRQSDGIVLADYYDFIGYDKPKQESIKAHQVTVEEVKKAWNLTENTV